MTGLVRHQVIEEKDFFVRQDELGFGIRRRSMDHCHPENPPAQNTEHGDQLHKALRRSHTAELMN
jgi:hypothetical protein